MRATPVLVLSLLLAAACATTPAPGSSPSEAKGPDLETLRAEDLASGPDRLARHEAAAEAYAARDWEEAARRYVAILEADPTDPIAWYNLACVYGLMGRAEQAADFLGGAWEAGFRNLAQIRADPDFAAVRDDPAFQATLARLADELAKGPRMTVVTHPARMVGEVLVVPPTPYEPDRRYPVLFALHGWGGEAAGFADLLGRPTGQPFFLAVPQAPYPVPGATGRSWFLVAQGAPREAAHGSQALTEGSLMAALDTVLAEFPIDPTQVYLAGFSQGGHLAHTLALHHPDRFRAAAPIGGWLDPAQHEAPLPDDTELEMLILHSRDDTAVGFAEAEAARDWLAGHEVPVGLWTYEGGHVVSEAVRDRIHAWVAAGGAVGGDGE